jgi:hypothetical protein
MLTSLDRLNSKILPEPNSGCWLWTGCQCHDGYPQTREPETQKKVYAHRLIYELARGIIPKDHDLDHTCFVRSCVNPDHLRPLHYSINRGLNQTPRIKMSADERRRRDAERHRTARKGKCHALAS